MKFYVWMTAALLSFSLMAIGARELSADLDTIHILFYRSLIGLLLVSVYMFIKRVSLSTPILPWHVGRNIFHLVGQYGWFLGISLLPLAEVFALEFTTPAWGILIAWLFLKEQVTRYKVIALCAGFIGVLVIVKPGIDIVNPAALIVLAAAAFFASSLAFTKKIMLFDDAILVIFYMCLIQLIIVTVFMFSGWVLPVGITWFWLFIVGFTALSAHYCLAKSMLYAELSKVMAFDYLRLPLIAVVGALFYQEGFEWSLLFGAALMLAANIYYVKQQNHCERAAN